MGHQPVHSFMHILPVHKRCHSASSTVSPIRCGICFVAGAIAGFATFCCGLRGGFPSGRVGRLRLGTQCLIPWRWSMCAGHISLTSLFARAILVVLVFTPRRYSVRAVLTLLCRRQWCIHTTSHCPASCRSDLSIGGRFFPHNLWYMASRDALCMYRLISGGNVSFSCSAFEMYSSAWCARSTLVSVLYCLWQLSQRCALCVCLHFGFGHCDVHSAFVHRSGGCVGGCVPYGLHIPGVVRVNPNDWNQVSSAFVVFGRCEGGTARHNRTISASSRL